MIKQLFNSRHFNLTAQILGLQCRRPMTYIMRSSILLICILVAMSSSSIKMGTMTGLFVLSAVGGFNLLLISFVAIKFFSDIIVSEKEQGTLGLIMITPLHPVSVLSAKAVPLFFSLGILIFMQLPLVIFAHTLGGVSITQILLFFLICFFHLLMIAGICMPVSTFSKKAGHALGLSVILLFFFSMIPTLITALKIFLETSSLNETLNFSLSIQGWYIWQKILSNTWAFDEMLIFTGSSTLILIAGILLSLKLMKRIDLSNPGESTKKASGGKRQKRNRAWVNAHLWKDFYFFGGGVTATIVKIIVLLAILFYIPWQFSTQQVQFFSRPYFDLLIKVGSFLMMLVFGLEFFGYTSTFIQKEIKGKTLSNAMLQPISVREFLLKKFKAAFFTSLVSFSLMIILLLLNIDKVIIFIKSVKIPGVLAIMSLLILFYSIGILSAIAYRKEKTLMEKFLGGLVAFIIAILVSVAAGILVDALQNHPMTACLFLSVLFLGLSCFIMLRAEEHLLKILEMEN